MSPKLHLQNPSRWFRRILGRPSCETLLQIEALPVWARIMAAVADDSRRALSVDPVADRAPSRPLTTAPPRSAGGGHGRGAGR